jgi:thiosulfate/3-mercaptopyruvate sulfurtransferase
LFGVTGPLIGVEGLRAALDQPQPPLLLDVRWRLGGPPGRDGYLAGHLPGAVWTDLDADLAGPPGAGGRHPLPDPADAEATLRRLGVFDGRGVVVYDDVDGSVAARAWWLLRWLGHPDVRLLDGGLPAWAAAGLPLEQVATTAEPGDFTARPGGMPLLDADEAARVAATGLLLDARAPERFRGEVEPVDPVAGHLPGARSAPATGNVGTDGRFLDPDTLRRRFDVLGAVERAPVGAYCGSGVTAAHTVLALELAGIPAALYAGSWSEWVTDPSRPVATGGD